MAIIDVSDMNGAVLVDKGHGLSAGSPCRMEVAHVLASVIGEARAFLRRGCRDPDIPIPAYVDDRPSVRRSFLPVLSLRNSGATGQQHSQNRDANA